LEVDAANVEREKAGTMAEFKERSGGIRKRIRALAVALHTGAEERPVEVREVLDVSAGRMNLLRLDTGEVLRFRKATAEDTQLELPPPKGSRR